MINQSNQHRCFPYVTAVVFAAVLSACGGGDDGPSVATNQLYSQTNMTANSVVHMVRNADGSLAVKNSALTGGAGTNTGADPLTSQNSVIVTPDHSMILAVNAASNSVSSFTIDATTGDLKLTANNTTTGVFPVSMAYGNGHLYVLFQGSMTVQAYPISNGVLGAPIGSYSIPNAGAKATEVTLSPNGGYLVVSAGTSSNELVSYPIDASTGALGTAIANTVGIAAPFAGVFLNSGVYLSTDAGGHALQSLNFNNGIFTSNGAEVVGDPAGNPCWLVITPDGKYAYTGDGGSGTIVSYGISSTGALTLLNAKAANEAIAVAGDSWISGDGKFLYSAALANGTVIAYSIGADGSLSKVGTPAIVTTGNTMQGLVGL